MNKQQAANNKRTMKRLQRMVKRTKYDLLDEAIVRLLANTSPVAIRAHFERTMHEETFGH